MNSELGSFENVTLKYQFDRPIGPRHLLSLGYRNIETRLTTCDLQVPVHVMNLSQNYDVKPMAVSHAIVAGADFFSGTKVQTLFFKKSSSRLLHQPFSPLVEY